MTGDVSALDLPTTSFDGVWCERVLQHVDDADAAIGELVRVTRPGGRVCLLDTDWALAGLRRRRPPGWPPRSSPTCTAALTPRAVRHGPYPAPPAGGPRPDRRHRDPGDLLLPRPGLGGRGAADGQPAGAAGDLDDPGRAARRWFDQVDAAGERGDFLAVLTIWVVSGTV